MKTNATTQAEPPHPRTAITMAICLFGAKVGAIRPGSEVAKALQCLLDLRDEIADGRMAFLSDERWIDLADAAYKNATAPLAPEIGVNHADADRIMANLRHEFEMHSACAWGTRDERLAMERDVPESEKSTKDGKVVNLAAERMRRAG